MQTATTVTTVTGDMPLGDLGVTLTHEHLHMNFDVCYIEKPSSVLSWPLDLNPTKESVFALVNLGIIHQYPYSIPYNLKMDDDDTKRIMLDELRRFKELGGKTIVENTVHGISRNIELLRDLSLESGVNIISGTGFYVAASHQPSMLSASVEKIHDQMLKELEDGCEAGIKCGIIGELGCSWPLQSFERNMIEAAALLQKTTKKPITFHPSRNWKSPFEIMRIFMEAGGDPNGVVMSHLDRTILEEERLLEFANLKAFNQFDLFGTECSMYQFNEEIDMVSDAQRIQKIRCLVENGHLQKILMSHDIHTKHRLVNFGGHGYGHLLQNVVPKMRKRGFTDDEMTTLLEENPKNWLAGIRN